jgi:hypothetical protein
MKTITTSIGIGIASVVLLLLSGCGSDNSVSDTNTVYHKEFIKYDLIRKYSPYFENGGIGPEDIYNWTLDFGCLVGPELIPVKQFSDFVENFFHNRKTTQQTAELIDAVEGLQQEIDALQKEIENLSAQFFQFEASETYADFVNAVKVYDNQYKNFTGDSNNYLLYIADCGGYSSSPPTSFDFNTAVSNTSCINNSGASAENFIASLEDVSGTQMSQDAKTDIYKTVTADDASALVQMYQALQRYFLLNLVPLLPDDADVSYDPNDSLAIQVELYNDNIIGMFQSAVMAVQIAYNASSLNNQINYAQGVLQTDADPITKFYENNANLQYTYNKNMSESDNYDAYKELQTELSLVYAARLNVMVEKTLSYIYSDQPLKDFVYPSMQTDNDTLNKLYANKNYSEFYKDTLSSSKLDASILGDAGMNSRKFPAITADGGYIYYMYDGLNQFTACQDAILQGQDISSTTCPPVYEGYDPLDTPGYYSGTYLSAWLYNPTAKKAVMTASADDHGTNLHKRCDKSAYEQSDQDYWDLGGVTTAVNELSGFNCATNTEYQTTSSDVYSSPDDWYYKAGSGEPHATFYFAVNADVDFTYGTLFTGGDVSDSHYGIKKHDNTKVFFIDTAKFVKYSGNSFLLALDVNEYTTSINIGMYQSQHGFNIHTTFDMGCNGLDPVCVVLDDGLCLGGEKITFDFEDKSNTAKVTHGGGC